MNLPPMSITSHNVDVTAFKLSTEGIDNIQGLEARNSNTNPSWPGRENKWMNEWTKKQTNERTIEWMNK